MRVLDVTQLGAKGDGVHDDSDAFALAFKLLSGDKIFDPKGDGRATHGLGKIYVPKGKCRLRKCLTFTGSLGLTIQGEGRYASVLVMDDEPAAPNGHAPENPLAMFTLVKYGPVHFEDLTFVHEPNDPGVKSEWKLNLLNLSGDSGGRELRLSRCRTQNFHHVFNFDYLVKRPVLDEHGEPVLDASGRPAFKLVNVIGNEDTNTCIDCTFENCREFLICSSSQAVLNSYENCSWSEGIEKVFNVAGFGRTRVTNGNVVIHGTLLHLRKSDPSGPQLTGPSSVYTFQNTKLEWHGNRLSSVDPDTPALLHAYGDTLSATVTFDQCALIGGTAPATPGVLAHLRANGLNLKFMGGKYDGIFKLETHSGNFPARANFIKFEDAHLTHDLDDWTLTRTRQKDENGVPKVDSKGNPLFLGGVAFPNISFVNTVMGGGHATGAYDFTWALRGVPYLEPHRVLVLSLPDKATDSIFLNSSNPTTEIRRKFFGQPVMIRSLEMFVTANSERGDGDKTIEVLHVQPQRDGTKKEISLGRLLVSGGSMQNRAYKIPLAGNTRTKEDSEVARTLVTELIIRVTLSGDTSGNRVGGTFVLDMVSV